jgi:hypothetical protein
MPLPIPQHKPASISMNKPRYKVFVSYSHKNSIEAKQFVEMFKSVVSVSQDSGIAPYQIFFDREKLLAGDQWAEFIHQAMEEAQYFVILLSPESITSEYCLTRELATAAARGLPIIQVLLSKCDGWADLVVPSDLRMRKLGSFGALPKDDNFNYLPLAEWAETSRTKVWKRVAQDIVERIRRDKSEPQSQLISFQDIPRNPQQRRVPPVPYFCNQKIPANQFDGGVQGWKDKALLVLTRGLYQDEVPRFWDRLQHKNLKDYVRSRKEELLPARPFVWPELFDQQPDREALRSQMLRALSDALTGNMFEVGDLSSFAARLAVLPGIQPLVTTLPDLPIHAISSGLRTLLELLEQCSVEAAVHRLVIAILLEDTAFVQEPSLEARLNLDAYKRTHVVVLDPLQVIERKDVSLWHRNYEVEQLYQVDEDTLLQGVFGEGQTKTLRSREFAKKVAPFLKEMERII